MNGLRLAWRQQSVSLCLIFGVAVRLFLWRHHQVLVLRSVAIAHCSSMVATRFYAALLGIKAYVEIFEGRMNKKTVDYENFRQSTHAAIALFLASSLAYHIALWPHYRWNSIIVLSLAFFGVILQFLLLVPSWVQNIVGFVALTFFMQEYK